MRLHYTQVRRSRRLAMPLPPTPKRPLGPPVLFCWEGVDICVRADVDRTRRTWNEFLDDLVAFRLDPDSIAEGLHALHAIERLVPPADLQDHRDDVRRRVRERRAAMVAERRAFQGEVAEKGIGGLILDRLFGKAA